MANFTSHYVELGFYVDGQYRQFRGGSYVTEDPADISVLESLSDVVRVDEVKPEEPVKPASKAPAARKPSGK